MFMTSKAMSAGSDIDAVYSLTGAVYVGTSGALNLSKDSGDTIRGLFIHPDGSTIWIGSYETRFVYEFALSTPNLITSINTTATAIHDFTGDLATVTARAITGVAFNADGTRFFASYATTDLVYQWTVSTPWDLTSTVTLVDGTVATRAGPPAPIAFTPDGTRIVTIRFGSTVIVAQYLLSTPWDLDTNGSNEGTLSSAVGTDGAGGGAFRGGTGDYWYQDDNDNPNGNIILSSLDSPNSIVAGITTHSTLDVSAHSTTHSGLHLSRDGKQLFIGTFNTGGADQKIFQYSLGAKVA